MPVNGFLLGLANGPTCLLSCAPVVVPYLVGEARAPRPTVPLLGRFLLGRLAGYLLFGLAAGFLGAALGPDSPRRGLVFGVVYCALAGLLLAYGLSPKSTDCPASRPGRWRGWLVARWPSALPLALGLLTGLSWCPPFLLAVAGAADAGSVAGSVAFFGAFFVGTSLYFLPLPGLGLLHRSRALVQVARLAAAVIGAVYLYRGVVLVYGGIVAP
jgi:sulfite exporter TauE/SafE